jgi:hypothetical protein
MSARTPSCCSAELLSSRAVHGPAIPSASPAKPRQANHPQRSQALRVCCERAAQSDSKRTDSRRLLGRRRWQRLATTNTSLPQPHQAPLEDTSPSLRPVPYMPARAADRKPMASQGNRSRSAVKAWVSTRRRRQQRWSSPVAVPAKRDTPGDLGLSLPRRCSRGRANPPRFGCLCRLALTHGGIQGLRASLCEHRRAQTRRAVAAACGLVWRCGGA